MGQFSVHSNSDPATQEHFPLFVDIQDDLLSFMATRVVIPLTPCERHDYDIIPMLAPTITVEAKRYLLLAPQLMHLKASQLGPIVTQLEAERHDVLRSVEMIFRGL